MKLLFKLLVSLCLLSNSPAVAQEEELDALNAKVEELHGQGRFGEAVEVAQQALKMAERALRPDHPDVATSLNNLAELYRDQGKYGDAEPLYKQSLAIREKALGSDHPDVATSLNNLAELYRDQGNYGDAEPLYNRSLAIREKALGPDHPDVASSFNNLAELYESQGRYEDVEPLYKRSLAIREKALGPDHPDVASSFNNLAELYESQGKYEDVEPLYKRSLAIREKALGPDHPDVATSLNNLAGLYESLGRYEDVEPLYKRSLAIREKALGPDHPDVANSLNNLAYLYQVRGRYEDVEPLYKQSLAIWEKALGPDHPDVAISLNNLAYLYESQGRYGDAEPLYKQSLAIREKALGPDHPGVARSLNNLALLYQALGRYEAVEPLYKRSLVIREKALGPDHPEVASSLNNLAGLYDSRGKYEDAEPLYKQSLAILERALGPDHPDVATSLGNLAVLYDFQGKYAEAEPLYRRSLTITEGALGPDHPGVAKSLNNLAALYDSQGKYAESEALYQRSLTIREEALGPDHPDVASTLGNLAGLYRSQGKYAEAEPLAWRSLTIMEEALGPGHPGVATSLNNLAALYESQGKYAAAEPLVRRSLTIREQALGPDHPDVASVLSNLGPLEAALDRPRTGMKKIRRALLIDEMTMDNVFSSSSEREKLTFAGVSAYRVDLFHSLVAVELRGDSEATQAGLDVALRRKGLVLDALGRERALLQVLTDPAARKALVDLRVTGSQLASLTLAGPGDLGPGVYRNRLIELGVEKERLEGALATLSQSYADKRAGRRVDASRVARLLKQGSVLVEIVHSPMYDFDAIKAGWLPAHYLAYVQPADPDAQPTLVDLGEAEHIDDAVQAFRRAVNAAPATIASTGEAQAERLITEHGKRLYDLVIESLKPAIGEARILYISPDAELNLIPFGALQDSEGRYLVETYQVRMLASGRDLVRYESKQKGTGKVLVIADPDFSGRRDGEGGSDDEESPLASNVAPRRSADLRMVSWSPLLGTRREAEAIREVMSDADIAVFTGPDARERVIKEAEAPRILHLATHGFFLETQKSAPRDNLFGRGLSLGGDRPGPPVGFENPLLRSGLVFAGANRLGDRDGSSGEDDGILTALEVSGLNLRGTDLVVLSACETGLGETRRGEGVFGLHRAFQLAGARTVVMSLWSVPDEETATLMTDYYRRMKAGEGKAEALQNAQLTMINGRREKHGAAHPLYWGAFVSVGEP